MPVVTPKVFYESFSYQAQSWDHPRRVAAKVEWHFDELFPRVGFIVTNMTGWSRTVVKFYNGRDTAEQWIKEGKYAVKPTRENGPDLASNTWHSRQNTPSVLKSGRDSIESGPRRRQMENLGEKRTVYRRGYQRRSFRVTDPLCR